MPLLKLIHGRFLPALEEASQEVTLNDWCDNPQAHADATVLVVSNDASLSGIRKDLNGFDSIVLDFPSFTDGRAYSQARLLRERYGFTGEIRARGDILRDQIWFMTRCGIDAFEFDGAGSSAAQDALREFTFAYQPAADGADPVWRKRARRAAAA